MVPFEYQTFKIWISKSLVFMCLVFELPLYMWNLNLKLFLKYYGSETSLAFNKCPTIAFNKCPTTAFNKCWNKELLNCYKLTLWNGREVITFSYINGHSPQRGCRRWFCSNQKRWCRYKLDSPSQKPRTTLDLG